jgi:acetolactate synthase I/II/III large subunit
MGMKYSDLMASWLVELGYTHCFFVAGGNIMHMMESCSRYFTAVPVIHEVAAGIAAEYFNEIHGTAKAFALVTAGPGLTNIVTAIAAAFHESRELLVIGGQVKTPDLARGQVRQRGFQEIDGVTLVESITVRATRLDDIVDRAGFVKLVSQPLRQRKGTIFLELPLDIQARSVEPDALQTEVPNVDTPSTAIADSGIAEEIAKRLREAKRPVIMLGGGVDRKTAAAILDRLAEVEIPVMTSWTGADRIPSDHPLYFGRPNMFGQRYANILLQQADVLAVFGSRLGIQHTGYNWEEFVPVGEIIHVDIDPAEVSKGHPKIALPVCADANPLLQEVLTHNLGKHEEWVSFCREVKQAIPLIEDANKIRDGYISSYVFVDTLARLCLEDDVVIPCSSGGAYTVMFQTFSQKRGQKMVADPGMASMGYGLSGAIGAAIAAGGRRTVLIEGDGGFTQNLQELGTLARTGANLKVFLFDDDGYSSIRMVQRTYFAGRYVGCDTKTGLGMPKWQQLFGCYDIPVMKIGPGFEKDELFLAAFNTPGPRGFLVQIDPEQTCFPKISSRMTETGMVSNPLHLMTPPLDEETAAKVFRYVPV